MNTDICIMKIQLIVTYFSQLEKPVDEDIENGPTIHEACKTGDLERVKKLLNYKSAWKE